mgnify:CR=1 FL=1
MEAVKTVEAAGLDVKALFEVLQSRGWKCSWDPFVNAYHRALEMYGIMGRERGHAGMRVLLVAEEVGWKMGLAEAANIEEMLGLKNVSVQEKIAVKK